MITAYIAGVLVAVAVLALMRVLVHLWSGPGR